MIGYKIIKFDIIDSTNNYMKKHISSLEHGTMVIANEQTNGRGRFGNTWISEPGNLFLSILIKSQEFKDNIFDLHIKTSVVILKLLQVYNISAKIKYPNDILVHNKKISGILVEKIIYESETSIILGIGINVNQVDFCDLKYKATSIKIETNKFVDLDHLVTDFITIFNQKTSIDNLYKEYLDHSLLLDKIVEYKNKKYIIKTIKKDGQIVLKNKEETLVIDYDRLSLSHLYANL
ncbi:MAG: biotin--[acetyl-CoA-carboxylase] ligase [Tenericutes bacterium]|nr:biotin--[acetyl-CoA-carboxylase] ligase [Mycoplasmatota bacterium]